MVSIGTLFSDFMELVGLHYYDKSESDTKFALKSEIPSTLTIDSSLSSTSENPVQNKVIKSALDGKSNTDHTHSQYLTSHQDISGKLDKAQGSSKASKNVVTDTNGNITTEDKPTIPTKVSDLTNDSNYVTTSDSRLSDARTPTSHTHGDITNDGKIGSTANKPIITTTNGKLTTGSFGTAANTFCQGNDSRLSNARTPTSHTHGNLTNDGKIGSASGKIITTGTSGVLQASDSITKSMISDFPSSMTPSSHTHNATEVSDSSAYTNIGSSANANQHTINDKINTALGNKANSSNVYAKSETYNQSEITTAIGDAVSNLTLFEVVESLPTSNIKTNRLYLIVNGESITNNSYDIYLRVNNTWEQLDSLEFDIANYYNKTETDTLLAGKVDTTDSRLSDTRTPKSHTHGNITNAGAIGSTANKPIITTTSGKLTTGSFGTTANTFCQGNDSRLSDARTPTAHTHTKSEISDFPTTMTPSSHTHTKSEITDFPTTMTPSSHTHGNLQNDGIVKVSSTVQKSKNLVTDSNGYITAEDKYSHPSSHPASMITGLSTVATSGSYSDLSNKPTIPTGSSTATDIKMNGTQSAGSSSNFAKADHVHPSDTSRVAVSQGTSNSGKFLKVNSSGNVACESVTIPAAYTHPSTTQCTPAFSDIDWIDPDWGNEIFTLVGDGFGSMSISGLWYDGEGDILYTQSAQVATIDDIPSPYSHPSTKQCNYSYTHPSSQQCTHNHDSSYVAKSQGTTNNGKFLKVSSGNVVCESVSIPSDISELSDTGSIIPIDIGDLSDNTGIIPTDTADLTNGAGFLSSLPSHAHGNITDEGKVGSTADYFVYTTTGGAVTSKEKIGNITTAGAIGTTATKPIITTTNGVLTTGSFGTTSGTFCQGNDSRLHSHTFTYSGGKLTIT